MINLYRFYNDIFSKFHFSITGYNDIGNSLDDYFNTIAKNSFFFEQKELLFISFAFAQLKESTDGLVNWETTSLNSQKKFLFHCFQSRQMEVILDLYYSFRELLSTIDAHGLINKGLLDEPTAEVIANLFNNFPSFRILSTEQKNVIMEFEQRKFLWTFYIPIESCISENKSLLNEFNETLKKVTALEIEKQKFSIIKYKSTYKWDKENPSNEYKEIRDEFINIFNLDMLYLIRKELINQIKYFQNQHKVFFEEKNIESNINHWANSIIAGAFLSFVFNAYMEYIPGVSNVEEGKNQDQGIKFKSLGAMIIGYDKENPIDNELRTLFRIMSDRISSAIAGNYLKNEYQRLSIKNLSEEASLCFGVGGIKQLTHNGSSYYQTNSVIENTNYQLQKLQRVFDLLDTSPINSSIQNLKDNFIEFNKIVSDIREFNGTQDENLKNIRDIIEIDSRIINDYIKDILSIKDSNYIDWESSLLKTCINPIEILSPEITNMVKSFTHKSKGAGVDTFYFTIYSNELNKLKLDSNYKSDAIYLDNYIFFLHAEPTNGNNLNSSKIPNWLSELENKIPFIGEFFYSYIDNGKRKFFDAKLNEVGSSTLLPLNQAGIKLTTILNKQSRSLPIWYILNFKTFKQ